VKRRRGLAALARRLARIRLVCLDVDGTLTDGALWIGPGGEEWKRFDVRDGLAIVAARRAGLRIAFVSGRSSTGVAARARDLGVADDLQGVKDKAAAVRDLRAKHGLPREAVLFAGDDVVDLPGFAESGVAVAPADARPEALAAADAVVDARGGHGAVREILEAVLRARGETAALPGLAPGRSRRRRA
jgi:3-deoxy-D-manno-octulosonate 8-phosphate phosphatase (KDO 8-P phosphatase)